MDALFETDEDRARQQSVADQLARLWRCQIVKRQPFSRLDWSAVRDGNLVAVLELKCRNIPYGYYPTLWVADAKRKALIEEAETFDVPGIFVVRFTDMLCYVKVTDITGNKVVAGREPRPGSTNDIELMVELPMERLRIALAQLCHCGEYGCYSPDGKKWFCPTHSGLTDRGAEPLL